MGDIVDLITKKIDIDDIVGYIEEKIAN